MKSRDRITFSLSAAALGLALALPQAALAEGCSEQMAQASASIVDTQVVAAASTEARPMTMRFTRTGSNIARYRTDESLPVSEYDRTYIDRTGASTTAEMLRTIPQIQVGR